MYIIIRLAAFELIGFLRPSLDITRGRVQGRRHYWISICKGLLAKLPATKMTETLPVSWHLKIQYRVYKSPPLDNVLGPFNPIQNFTSHFPKIHFHMIVPYKFWPWRHLQKCDQKGFRHLLFAVCVYKACTVLTEIHRCNKKYFPVVRLSALAQQVTAYKSVIHGKPHQAFN